MKLVIQIPCLNEAETLPLTLKELPRRVTGFDEVLWLVVDDGSSDNTAEVARLNGVDVVIRLKRNVGLAGAFAAGLRESIRQGADVIVNTDADNQYNSRSIPDLVAPIVKGSCDVAIGCRPNQANPEFSKLKKFLQKFGSKIISKLARVEVIDAASGFRAYSRDAAIRTRVFSSFSYTMETLIQYGHSGFTLANVPILVNPSTRPSRLFKNMPSYLIRSAMTAVRSYLIYAPFRLLSRLSLTFIAVGALCISGWMWRNFSFNAPGRSLGLLIIGVSNIIVGVQFVIFAFLSELLSFLRKNQEFEYVE